MLPPYLLDECYTFPYWTQKNTVCISYISIRSQYLHMTVFYQDLSIRRKSYSTHVGGAYSLDLQNTSKSVLCQ